MKKRTLNLFAIHAHFCDFFSQQRSTSTVFVYCEIIYRSQVRMYWLIVFHNSFHFIAPTVNRCFCILFFFFLFSGEKIIKKKVYVYDCHCAWTHSKPLQTKRWIFCFYLKYGIRQLFEISIALQKKLCIIFRYREQIGPFMKYFGTRVTVSTNE